MKIGFRFYYDKDLTFLIQEENRYMDSWRAERSAKQRQRAYANLFNRDMRKILLKPDSVCVKCKSPDKLEMDHIIPVSKGGKNEANNIQILCQKCNSLKRNNEN